MMMCLYDFGGNTARMEFPTFFPSAKYSIAYLFTTICVLLILLCLSVMAYVRAVFLKPRRKKLA